MPSSHVWSRFVWSFLRLGFLSLFHEIFLPDVQISAGSWSLTPFLSGFSALGRGRKLSPFSFPRMLLLEDCHPECLSAGSAQEEQWSSAQSFIALLVFRIGLAVSVPISYYCHYTATTLQTPLAAPLALCSRRKRFV